MALTQLWVLVYLDSWQIHELRVATMRNALESGVERTKRKKNISKVTQELVERTVRKRKIYKKYKQEKKRVTYTNEERRENNKVKEYEKLGEIK